MRCLLDADVLIAPVVEEHEHHERATRWAATVDAVALCPVVEGALVRYLVGLVAVPGEARLATLDRALSEAHPDLALLLPDVDG